MIAEFTKALDLRKLSISHVHEDLHVYICFLYMLLLVL